MTITEYRNRTDEILDAVIEGEETVVVALADGRPGSEWQSMDETAYHTSSAANRAALLQRKRRRVDGPSKSNFEGSAASMTDGRSRYLVELHRRNLALGSHYGRMRYERRRQTRKYGDSVSTQASINGRATLRAALTWI